MKKITPEEQNTIDENILSLFEALKDIGDTRTLSKSTRKKIRDLGKNPDEKSKKFFLLNTKPN